MCLKRDLKHRGKMNCKEGLKAASPSPQGIGYLPCFVTKGLLLGHRPSCKRGQNSRDRQGLLLQRHVCVAGRQLCARPNLAHRTRGSSARRVGGGGVSLPQDSPPPRSCCKAAQIQQHAAAATPHNATPGHATPCRCEATPCHAAPAAQSCATPR